MDISLLRKRCSSVVLMFLHKMTITKLHYILHHTMVTSRLSSCSSSMGHTLMRVTRMVLLPYTQLQKAVAQTSCDCYLRKEQIQTCRAGTSRHPFTLQHSTAMLPLRACYSTAAQTPTFRTTRTRHRYM